MWEKFWKLSGFPCVKYGELQYIVSEYGHQGCIMYIYDYCAVSGLIVHVLLLCALKNCTMSLWCIYGWHCPEQIFLQKVVTFFVNFGRWVRALLALSHLFQLIHKVGLEPKVSVSQRGPEGPKQCNVCKNLHVTSLQIWWSPREHGSVFKRKKDDIIIIGRGRPSFPKLMTFLKKTNLTAPDPYMSAWWLGMKLMQTF